MADIKISQLGAAVAVADADVIPATANGVTVKVPASVLKEYAIGGTDISSIGDGTPTGAISALKSVKIEKTDIAPIETSVASKAYAVGDQLYYNGMLYSVIAAIAQGETLVVDTNIELSDKVTEQIKALKGSVDLVNADLQKEVTTRAALGAHNLLPIETGTSMNRGVTYTVADKTVTVSGTVTSGESYSYKTLCETSNVDAFKGKNVKFSGNGKLSNSLYLDVYLYDSNSTATQHYTIKDNSETSLSVRSDTVKMIVSIVVLDTFDGAPTLVNPMMRLATDTDPTYKPYAKTNRELTEEQYVSATDLSNNNDFTVVDQITIPEDGLYYLGLQNNVSDSGSALIIRLGTSTSTPAIAGHRTAGNAYEKAETIIPLKKGTVVSYSCNNAGLSCQSQYYKFK